MWAHEFGAAPGGMVPVQLTVTVWPAVDGTVTLWSGGFDAPAKPARRRGRSR